MSEKRVLTKRRTRILLWFCLLTVAGLIFAFSAEDGAKSTRTSNRIVRIIVYAVYPDYDSLPSVEKRDIWRAVSHHVRKSAHFLEFAALGFFLRLLTGSYALRFSALLALLAGIAYAAADELHQLFSTARSGMWQDVLIDSAGVLFGALAALALITVVSLMRRRKVPLS